ncbi:MAG: DUF805 domain-containing protein [Burkholderiaceae bacterium]|jgi:uncharacterized membrane protein YhaH (DUF805 family)|nr:DUF805 domain-containing protein [Burkholderiaceae bacterium]
MTGSSNPYAPPVAAVADIVPGQGVAFQPVRIFATKGRMGRLRYVAYMLAANIIFGVAIWIIVMILAVAVGVSGMAAGGNPQPEQMAAMGAIVGVAFWVIWAIISVLLLIFFVLIGIQRSHDMNLPGWAVLLTFIPLVVLGWMLVPGGKGHNRFGAPPPPNSPGVKAVFGVSLFLTAAALVLVIIVAALAIPQYQSYVERARQTQSQQR